MPLIQWRRRNVTPTVVHTFDSIWTDISSGDFWMGATFAAILWIIYFLSRFRPKISAGAQATARAESRALQLAELNRTLEKKVEESALELKQVENKFKNTFEKAAVGMAHVGLDGKWLQVNPRLCEITGYSEDELLQKTFADITHPDDLNRDWD